MKTKKQLQSADSSIFSRILQQTRVVPGSAMDLLLTPVVGTLLFLLLTQGFLEPAVNFITEISIVWLFGLGDSPSIEPYATRLIILGITGVVVWAALAFLKARTTLYTAFISVSLALLLEALIAKHISDNALAYVYLTGISFILFAAVNFLATVIRNELVLIVAAAITIAGSALTQPFVIQNTQNHASAANVTRLFNAGKDKLAFTVYYPDYHPSGTTITEPALNDYDSAVYGNGDNFLNLYVSYSMGPLVVYESAPLRNQEAVISQKGSCDISTLWDNVAAGYISETSISQSRQQATSCTYIGPLNDPIYKSALDNGDNEYVYYYKKVGGTNIIFEYQTTGRQKFSPSVNVDNEIVKIVSSMHEIHKDRLVKSGPDYYLDDTSLDH